MLFLNCIRWCEAHSKTMEQFQRAGIEAAGAAPGAIRPTLERNGIFLLSTALEFRFFH